MKIALLMSCMTGGGAQRSTYRLANELVKRGHLVDLVLLRKEGPYLEHILPSVRVVDLKGGKTIYSTLPFYRYIKHEEPDIVVSNLVNIPAIFANKLVGKKSKLIITERGNFTGRRTGLKRSLAKYLNILLPPIFYRRADMLVSVSQDSADDLVECGIMPREKVRVIYNPVVSDEIFELQKEVPHHEWLTNKKTPVVVAVGRMVFQKDYPSLLKAFDRLSDKNVRLIILGEGDERPELEKLTRELGISDRVSMPGFVDNPYSYMARADVFVSASKSEGLPGVLIQALACGVTPVATDCPGGSAEILENGRYGYLTSVEDSEALAVGIEKAISSPIDPKILQERSWFFSDKNSVDKWEALILEVAGAR